MWIALTDKRIISSKLGLLKIQSTDHIKLKKKDSYYSLSELFVNTD